jgi:MFS family permease
MMKVHRFEVNAISLLLSLSGVTLLVFSILESPTDLERWAALVGASVVSFGFFALVVDEVLDRRHNKGRLTKSATTQADHSKHEASQNDGIIFGDSTSLLHRKRNPFAYFVIIIASGAAGVGALALATVDYSETLFFVLILPALIGSIGLALAIDYLSEMEQDPFWQRLISAVLWGTLGAFVGVILIIVLLFIFIFMEGSGPPNNDLVK